MAGKKIATNYPGVRYREHETRKHGPRKDRYYFIRYTSASGRVVEEGVGWGSEEYCLEDVAALRSAIMRNIREGVGPQSLSAMRAGARAAEEADERRIQEERSRSMTLADVSERYLTWARLNKPKSAKTDAIWIAKHILPALGHLRLVDVNSAHVEEFKASLFAANYAPATIRHIIGQVRRIFNYASITPTSGDNARPLFEGDNPAARIKLPKLDNKRFRFFLRDEADRFLKAAQGYPPGRNSPDYHDACLLSLHTGMRKSEILNLCWHSINMETGLIHILDGKDNITGTIPINATARDMLERRKTTSTRNLVFAPPYRGRRMTGLSHHTAALLDELGMNEGIEDTRQRLCFHSFRHTFASWLVIAGVDLRRVMELMRHKDFSQTLRYAHLAPDSTRDAVELLAR